MSDEEVLRILKEFSDYLEIGNVTGYCLRWLGWFFIQGLAWLVDGLENITDSILGIKTFFASEGIQEFVQTIQPFLYVLLAFSFLYIGYMLIMNKKINREQIAMNVFVSLTVLLLLNTGMTKANKFTDDAISAVDLNGEGTVSEKIIKDGLTDVAQFDVNGWKSTELENPNNVSQENIKYIDITENIDDDFEVAEGKELAAPKVFENKMEITPDGKEALVELKNGWFDFFPEKYYRWHWDFWTIAISLFVTGMTMLFITIKLAKLCYELAFNYILANLVAPADVSNGQMLKQVLKSILNTFLVIIMIFISMKVYLMGTVFISEQLDGMAYLIALIAISIAVVDGPVMCERLFGIDAGLKSGWGAVAGGFALGKSVGNLAGAIERKTGAAKKAAGTVGAVGQGAGKALSKAGTGALLAGAGSAGVIAGLKGDNNDKQSSLKDEMKNDENKEKNQNGTGGLLSANSQANKDNTGGEQLSSVGGSNSQGMSLQDEMRAAGFTGDIPSSTSGDLSSSDTSDNDSVARGNSADIGSNTGFYDDMQSSGFAGESSSVNDSPVTDRGNFTGSTPIHQEMNSGTNSGDNTAYSQVAAASTTTSSNGSPVTQNKEVETRTIGQYARERVANRLNNSPTVQQAKRSYQIGVNTGENWRRKRENKEN
ncbi:hypothetical protein AC623_20350 [Bacillus sp. FJAT-27231]|uniref:pLS20_p028 family conjugation system transmembrane protein n=1 Tax=Bacillus sp. FJAT-27231 TaxID=1679168 RepID=UPI00069DA2FB|nr:hypothetical protein [Bacillus sp. FJAT-27231]KMY52497.1 hypothetical protein AC623_20350 [Bacillus sp. FJAT-27231]